MKYGLCYGLVQLQLAKKIIVAFFKVLEKFVHVVIGWLPLYGGLKLALFVYMWYPKSKEYFQYRYPGKVYKVVVPMDLCALDGGIGGSVPKGLRSWVVNCWKWLKGVYVYIMTGIITHFHFSIIKCYKGSNLRYLCQATNIINLWQQSGGNLSWLTLKGLYFWLIRAYFELHVHRKFGR
ncbi:putative HVA22 protein g [Trifolium repens]|nr:putative HVA22 protein g [Trifolium repens]